MKLLAFISFPSIIMALQCQWSQQEKQQQEQYQYKWHLTENEIIDYDALPDVIYNLLFNDYRVSPGCPGATTEDECYYILGCSWCSWNNLGCIYKDIADVLPIDVMKEGNELCESATDISGEPSEKQLFYFNYGRYPQIKVSRD